MCTQSVLDKCGSHVSEAIYMGTSAFPSVVGGVLQPSPSCDEPNQATDCESVIRVGDVCITPYAVNWDCKQADWSQHFFGSTNWDAKVNNLCWLPEENFGVDASFLYGDCMFYDETFGVDASFLYGECMFYDVPPGTHELVDELYAAANSNVAKDVTRQRSKAQLEYDHEYWTMMKEGLDLDYYMFKKGGCDSLDLDYYMYKKGGCDSLDLDYYMYNKGDNAFKTFTNCVEVDSQFFFSGPPYEATCRNLSAHVLNLATNSSDFASTDVVFANAMEGIGFNKAIMAYNKYSTRPIPFVNMRGASNYNHMPVANGPIAGTYVYAEPQLKPDFSAGYSTAIDNYSAVILALWQARCLAGVSESKKDKCNFSLQAGG
eukprot:gene4922-34692_t